MDWKAINEADLPPKHNCANKVFSSSSRNLFSIIVPMMAFNVSTLFLFSLYCLVLWGVSSVVQGKRPPLHFLNPELKSDPEPLVLHKDKANDFHASPKRHKRDLWEECYDEGCDREEVEESLNGHALYQYYYGWRCMKLYGGDWTYSYNPHRLQCRNSINGVSICASGRVSLSRGGYRSCYFGSSKNVYAVYMEDGCNDGELGSYRLNFNDPSRSVRHVYNVGCREKKSFSIVRGATSYTATLIGGGGGDGRILSSKLGWFGYNSRYCGNPGSPYGNGYFTGSNFYETSQVTYNCRYGYTLVGNQKRTCQWHGWDGSRPYCKRLCDPGTYSSTGYEPCTPCPLGQYQPNRRSRSCISCPSGKFTSQTGRKFQSDCHHKCSKAVCHIQTWSQWADSSSPYQTHCASQIRRRSYTKTWTQVLDPSGCNLVSKTCPSDQTEQRKKEVYCDPLVKPEFGYYLPSSCSTTKQPCRSSSSSTCVFHCNNGFERVGAGSVVRRTCQASGRWTFSDAKCKDITPPKITCPSNIAVGNDPGKPFARITLPAPTATDNSGKAPSIKIASANIEAIEDFNISVTPTKVTYQAMDNAGLSDTCSFYVQVKDTEKPAVLYCPDDYSVNTKERPKRIVFKEPKFKDNFDLTPKITSSHVSGQEFLWNTHTLTFNATDKAGNMESCSYDLQVGPLACKLYEPPANGIRACNIKFSGVYQEYVCTVQCRDNHDFVTKPEWHSYNCKEDGFWYGYKNFVFKKLAGKPWPDCSVKSPPTGVTKKVKVYAGTCLSGNAATQIQIKESFIASIKADFFMSKLLCMISNNLECQISNVKVYCGKNSKRKRRGLSENAYVILVDVEVLDLSPSAKESDERQKLKTYAGKIKQKNQQVQDSIKRAAAAAVKVQSSTVDVEDDQVTGACASGKVVLVKDGNGSELDRSECVDCSEGTFYDKATRSCIRCKKGNYQNKEGEEFCKACPSRTDTLGTGAKSIKDCKEFCSSGEHSASGLATCTACAVGQYQPNNRSTSCLPCPAGTSTMDVKTRSIEDCKKFCSAGYFSKDSGLGACIPCPRGSYQPNAKGISCITCPTGMTTADDGTTSAAQCKLGCGMDFEHGRDHWTKTGTAFDNQPTYGDNPKYRNRESSQHEGNWWIGGYENRPSSSMAAGQVQGDGPQGTLTSPSFLVTSKDISFLIGGGCDMNLVRVEFVIQGQVVKKETGKCFESMERRHWDVTAYQGKMAHVRLVDHSSGGWGHINFDDFRGDTCI